MSVEDDRIEKLKRKLYSRTQEPVLDLRSQIKQEEVPVQNAWGEKNELNLGEYMDRKPKTHPMLKKFLFAAILFFILSVAISVYVFFGGSNLISANNVDIQVAGQSSVASGDEVDLSVSLINQNHADLQSTLFTIDYPDGTVANKDSSTPLKHNQEDIGIVASGSSVDRTAKFFLFGDKGTVKTIKFQIEYQVAGSNAVFTKEKNYDITLGSSPVILDVQAPQEVNSGQEINFVATISSNSPSLLQSVIVSANYPYGFTYDGSSIKPASGNNIWNLGDLKSGDKKVLSINGKLVTQDGEQRTFRFSVGTKSTDSSLDIGTILGQVSPTITVSKPFISATLSLAGDTSDTVATYAGTNITSFLDFTNTLQDQINDVSVHMNMQGQALDRGSVQVGNGGFYQSTDGTIIWDKNSTPAFSQINPSDSKNLNFSFNTVKLPVGVKNPSIAISVTITGTRSSPGGSVEQISTTFQKTVKISADLSLVTKILRGGPIANSGPIPPKAENVSTYSADWILSNKWNDLSGTKVVTQLPPYVEWTGQVSPSTANITYSPDTRMVIWTPDSVSAGAGFTLSPKEVFFQLKIIPSLSQVGNAPQLTSDITLNATDNFSGVIINRTSPALTTQTADSNNSGFVVK